MTKFWKMHGLGNDYIIIDNRNGTIQENNIPELTRTLCERRFSIGADGLLLVYPSHVADVKMRIFNADGGEAEMCGNGIRCFTRYCHENEITEKEELRIETKSGIKLTWFTLDDWSVKVDMGTPILERSALPMLGKGTCIDEELDVENHKFKVTCLSVGNPHCITFVDDVQNFPVREFGPKIENHPHFPNRINVEFIQVINKNELKMRVWERGVGETLACGTGACASVVAGTLLHRLNNTTTVHLLGGDLNIEYLRNVFLTGPTEKVCEGSF